MAKTATDLAQQVLRELQKLDAIESAPAEDDDFIQNLSKSYHETLLAMKVNVHWSHDSIPEKVFYPLAGVLADVAARTYGVTVPELEKQIRIGSLRAAAATPYLGEPVKAEYF